ncbi:hypothetical protein ACA910_000478 [Epithemia clementina (nom. ined.)]
MLASPIVVLHHAHETKAYVYDDPPDRKLFQTPHVDELICLVELCDIWLPPEPEVETTEEKKAGLAPPSGKKLVSSNAIRSTRTAKSAHMFMNLLNFRPPAVTRSIDRWVQAMTLR